MMLDDIYMDGDYSGRKQPGSPAARYLTTGADELRALFTMGYGAENPNLKKFHILTAGLFAPPKNLDFTSRPYGDSFYGLPEHLLKKARAFPEKPFKSASPMMAHLHAAFMSSIVLEDHDAFNELLDGEPMPSDFAEELLRRGPLSPLFANAYGMTPLMVAAFCGNDVAVKKLLAHPFVAADEDVIGDGRTALYYAGISLGAGPLTPAMRDTMTALIDAGADIYAFDRGCGMNAEARAAIVKQLPVTRRQAASAKTQPTAARQDRIRREEETRQALLARIQAIDRKAAETGMMHDAKKKAEAAFAASAKNDNAQKPYITDEKKLTSRQRLCRVGADIVALFDKGSSSTAVFKQLLLADIDADSLAYIAYNYKNLLNADDLRQINEKRNRSALPHKDSSETLRQFKDSEKQITKIPPKPPRGGFDF